MLSRVIGEIDKTHAANASVSDPAAEDATLVSFAKNGSVQAFEILVERHQQRILAVAMRLTRIREDAEDVVQQSFQKAFVHLHKFEGKSSFSTWLTRIAINEALMLLRRGRGLREVSIDDSTWSEESGFALETPDLHPSPESSYSQSEEARILSEAMHKLRPGLRKAIELRELAELSTEETAQRMGLSVGAVKARLFHGRKKLRERLKHYFGSACTSGTDISRTIANRTHISQERLSCDACG